MFPHHMLLPSAQRWADNTCCSCIPPCPDYKTATALFPPSKTWEYVVLSDVYFAVLERFFFTILYFQLRSVGYIAYYKLNFQK